MALLFDEVVQTDYGQFDLTWDQGEGFDGESDKFFAGQANGLVGAATSGGLYINLARRSGGSSVRIDLLEAPPPSTANGEWEDVVEVSTVVPADAGPQWSTWAGEDSGPLNLPPGTYRVRISARGRDAGANDEFADGVVDHYLLEFWESPAEPDEIVVTTSENAAYWHREWGSNR